MAAETRTIAEEWADNVRRMGRGHVQQEMRAHGNPAPCGPADERGMCRNASHTMKCAEAMMSPTMRASFVSMSDPAAYSEAWRKAAEDNAANRARIIEPFAEAEEKARNERAEAARKRAEATAGRRGRNGLGSSWVESGAAPAWLFGRR